MKKLNLILLLFVILLKGFSQETCNDFSTIQTGSYNVGDTIFTTPDYLIVSDNYFSGGTCGANGSYIENTNFNFEMSGNISFNFDCSLKEVKFDFSPFAGQCFSFRVNDSVIGNEATLFLDTIPNVSFAFDATNNVLTMRGLICSVQAGADFLYLDEVCVLELAPQECTDYVTVSEPEGIYIFGDTTFAFSGTNQIVSMEIYGNFNNWDLSTNHQANQTYFTVNGGASVSLEDIYNNLPYVLNGATITVDTATLAFNSIGGNWTTGTIIFSGDINTITMTQFESGLLKICTQETSPQECTDYVTVSEPEGIYIFGDTTFSFSGANQTVSMEIYGDFNSWDLSTNHQANQTYFTVNGGASVSLEDIYNNRPYVLNGITITVDTTTLAFNSIGGNWTTGTIIFSGEINTITMTQFESGLLKICKAINSDCNCEHEDCPCNISVDFTYTSNSHNYYFTSAATGTEYEWSFGDGESSTIADPFHNYETAGTYEVCLTNYNLTDTCSITVCDTIVVTCTTPNANIITPNQDGIDDFIYLQCGDVKVYNRNGGLVIELVNQSIWGGNDSNGSLVPMGEYILVCQSTGITTSVSVIW